MTRRSPASSRLVFALLAVLALVEIGYPLTSGTTRAAFVVVAVVVGFGASVSHAILTSGVPAGAALVAVTAVGGFGVEALGVATGFPFGAYAYTDALGPRLLGVPLVIPLAWTWMAWPAWLVAGLLAKGAARIVVAAVGFAAWDLFLDPQMVAEHYWTWQHPHPGIAGIPWTNYAGWCAVALAMMALLSSAVPTTTLRTAPTTAREAAPTAAREAAPTTAPETTPTTARGAAPTAARIAVAPTPAASPSVGEGSGPMVALYLWTYASSVLAHAVFLGLAVSAVAGAIGMGLVAVPVAWRLRPT